MLTHPDFEVLEQKERENGHVFARIQIHPGATPNDLLRFAMTQLEIQVFRERIPSINEIFIRRVGETMPETLLAAQEV